MEKGPKISPEELKKRLDQIRDEKERQEIQESADELGSLSEEEYKKRKKEALDKLELEEGKDYKEVPEARFDRDKD